MSNLCTLILVCYWSAILRFCSNFTYTVLNAYLTHELSSGYHNSFRCKHPTLVIILIVLVVCWSSRCLCLLKVNVSWSSVVVNTIEHWTYVRKIIWATHLTIFIQKYQVNILFCWMNLRRITSNTVDWHNFVQSKK